MGSQRQGLTQVQAAGLESERAQRLEFCCTLRHGYGWQVARYELGCQTPQRLQGRRLGAFDDSRTEAAAWARSVYAASGLYTGP